MNPNRGNQNNGNSGDSQKPKSRALGTLLITLAIVLVISSIYNTVRQSQYTETTFSDFMDAFESGQLSEVELHTDRVIYMTKEEAAKEARNQKACYTGLPSGGDMLAQRLGGQHLYIPFSYDYDETEAGLNRVCEAVGVPVPDFEGRKRECEAALAETKALLGDTPIAIDYTFCPRPLGLAKLLLGAGMNVQRVYLDTVTGEERAAFEYLREHHPDLMLYPTVHAGMRFHADKEQTNFLAIGQKAAHFCDTPHFVNVVEGGGMLGYRGVLKTLALMREAYLEEKDTRNLIQIKGMGCGGCV